MVHDVLVRRCWFEWSTTKQNKEESRIEECYNIIACIFSQWSPHLIPLAPHLISSPQHPTPLKTSPTLSQKCYRNQFLPIAYHVYSVFFQHIASPKSSALFSRPNCNSFSTFHAPQSSTKQNSVFWTQFLRQQRTTQVTLPHNKDPTTIKQVT